MAQLVSEYDPEVSLVENSKLGKSRIASSDNPRMVVTSKMSGISLHPVSIVLIWYKWRFVNSYKLGSTAQLTVYTIGTKLVQLINLLK